MPRGRCALRKNGCLKNRGLKIPYTRHLRLYALSCVSSSRALDDDRDCTFKISYLTSFLLPILEVAEEHTQTSRVVMLVKLPSPGTKLSSPGHTAFLRGQNS